MTIPVYERAAETARYISAKAQGRAPRVAIVLGSGLGGVADAISDPVEIPYEEIPHFPASTVAGHAGKLIIGSCGGTEVVAMKGRFHFYEGHPMDQVTLPIRTFALMGIRSLVLTNAAGGAAPGLSAGDLMLITDHINMMGHNPLLGPNDDRFGPRFPDMTDVYTPEYQDEAREIARAMGIKLAEGVYLALSGPTYETPAEVRMLRGLGADALGMSTVPEAIVARHCGMKIVAFSCVTNAAAGLVDQEINHDEVMEVGKRAGEQLSRLIIGLLPRLASVDAGPEEKP